MAVGGRFSANKQSFANQILLGKQEARMHCAEQTLRSFVQIVHLFCSLVKYLTCAKLLLFS